VKTLPMLAYSAIVATIVLPYVVAAEITKRAFYRAATKARKSP
jgi:hypothetical protein